MKDGLIDDPRRCDFNPARDLPHCAEGTDQADCFTKDQIKAVERIYGDVMSQGKRFFPGWPVGAEVVGPNGQSGWIGQQINGPNGAGAWTSYGANFLRFVAPGAKAGNLNLDPIALFRQFDIDKDPARMDELHQILDATDTDLSAFRQRGGKMMMYFGWADPQLNARMGVEYYEQVVEKMGASTSEFFRLFMVPGMFHCGGGVGTSQFDPATPVVNWVEAGKAPERIEAGSRSSGQDCANQAAVCVSAGGPVQGQREHRRSVKFLLRETLTGALRYRTRNLVTFSAPRSITVDGCNPA